MSDSTSRPALSSETPPVPPSGPTGGGYPSQPSGAGSAPPGAPRHRGGGLPIPLVFVGGLVVVAGVTGLVLAARPKASPYTTFDPSSPYELPRVRGVERRKPRPGGPSASGPKASPRAPDSAASPPSAPGEGVSTPSTLPDGPAAPIFAPAASAVPPRPPAVPAPAVPPVEVASAPRAPDIPSPAGTPTAPALPDPSSPLPVPSPSVPLPGPSLPDPSVARTPAPGVDPALPVLPTLPGLEPSPDASASAPAAASTPEASPTPIRKAEGPADWRLLITGDEALVTASSASLLADQRRLVTPKGRAVHFSPMAGDEAEARSGVRFVVERRASSLTLTEVRLPEPADDPIAALVPPAGLVPDVLVGLPLEVPAASHVAALGALALLLSGDGPAAAALLDPKPTAPGLRVLLAYALLLKGELPKVHDVLFGLGDDPALGTVARFLTGAALLTDRNPREAIRDLQAALRMKPAFWPARLLEAESNAQLDLPEAASKGYEAVLEAVPDRPEAVLAQVYYLAGKDRPAAVAMVTRLVKARPDLVPAWWMLGWVRRQGDTSEDARAEVKAFETVVFLKPRDPDAWRELGTAQLRWADVAGGLDARRAAAAAFAEQVTLQPKDGLAWFNRGSVLHQLATEEPLAGDAARFAERLAEVRTCYAKALAAGTLGKPDAARVHHNVGLVIDLLPAGAGGAKAGDAYQAAADADPTYAQGVLALVAARVAERDAPAAAKALARVPADADAVEKGILTAAVRWGAGDAPGAAVALQAAGESPASAGDLALRVLRGLVVTGYRRAALTLLEAQPVDGPRLTLRVRARAALRDVAGLRADLLALGRIDAKLAEQLRARDPEVVATLGPPATRGSPEERLK